MRRSIAARRCMPVALFVAAGLPWLAAGCAERTTGLFTQSDLKGYTRLAVLGLTPEQEQIFMACYIRGFPEQSTVFVERGRLQDIIKEQDLLKPAERLDDKTRAKIRKILGVEALILCNYEEGLAGKGMKKLRVRIVDSASGAIVGSVITEASGGFESRCQQAIKSLRSDLYGRY